MLPQPTSNTILTHAGSVHFFFHSAQTTTHHTLAHTRQPTIQLILIASTSRTVVRRVFSYFFVSSSLLASLFLFIFSIRTIFFGVTHWHGLCCVYAAVYTVYEATLSFAFDHCASLCHCMWMCMSILFMNTWNIHYALRVLLCHSNHGPEQRVQCMMQPHF